ncbi:MAG: hypothetical protein MK116_13315 [Phycisphaerales bacterium]|nr:hypothetical protein [Phycisphaerales bacterium]
MKATTLAPLGLATIAVVGAIATAAPRKVMFEQFTASWCGPCQNVGYALGELTDNNPNTMVATQMHIWSSSYGFDDNWCEDRADFYCVSGIPHTQVNGIIERVGTAGQNADYNAYLSILNQQLAVPTDVVIEMTGEPLNGTTYRVDMTVRLEAGAPSRSMVVHCFGTLDADCGYPGPGYYYDTFFDHMTPQTISLSGGQSAEMQHTFTLNSTAANNSDEITFACFVQEPGSSGCSNNLDIYNVNFMDFAVRPPETFTIGAGGDFTTIQEGLDNAINGDLLLVEPGTYNERIRFEGVNCTLQSMTGPENTIIDGGGTGSVVSMLGSGSGTLSGFTIQNGEYSLGSGLKTNGWPTIDNCIFKDNVSTNDYVIFATSGPEVQNSYFCGNSHNTIGPDWVDGGGNTFEDDCPDAPCPGDLDNDGIVGVNDILALISGWGTPDGDVDGDNDTDVNDVLLVISLFGESC